MPINMGLAALLMSGAMNAGEPATKLTLGADAVSQPNGGAALVLARNTPVNQVIKKPKPRKPDTKRPVWEEKRPPG